MRVAWVALALAVTAAACDPAVPPPVAQRQPSLDADDLGVVEALFESVLRPGQLPGARLLVVDRTLAMCRRDPAAFGPDTGRCMVPAYSKLLSNVVPAQMSRAVAVNFPRWNAAPLAIAGRLGDDVLYVSPTLIDTVAPSELLRQYPPGSQVIMLSAPGYPAAREAVILYFRSSGSGAARFERQSDGRWRLAQHASWGVD